MLSIESIGMVVSFKVIHLFDISTYDTDNDLKHVFIPIGHMDQALQQLGFQRMEEVSTETLKRAFKLAAVESHPDK